MQAVLRDVRDGVILVEYPGSSGDEANAAAVSLGRRLREAGEEGLLDAVPGARTLLVVFDPDRLSVERLRRLVERAIVMATDEGAGSRLLRVPVVYDGEDLAELASARGISATELARRHAAGRYRVAFVGFAPGFAYLSGLPEELSTPRLATPRPRVPAGSVAIGGSWTGIYPAVLPGGWRLIGRTSVRLFDAHADPPSLLVPGDRVEFESVGPAQLPVPEPPRPRETGGPVVARVLSPGLSTTVQGAPRYGLASSGVPSGGAMDLASLEFANALVGNRPGAPALEITLAGPELEILGDTLLAVAGGEAPVETGGGALMRGEPFAAAAGDRVRIRPRHAGGPRLPRSPRRRGGRCREAALRRRHPDSPHRPGRVDSPHRPGRTGPPASGARRWREDGRASRPARARGGAVPSRGSRAVFRFALARHPGERPAGTAALGRSGGPRLDSRDRVFGNRAGHDPGAGRRPAHRSRSGRAGDRGLPEDRNGRLGRSGAGGSGPAGGRPALSADFSRAGSRRAGPGGSTMSVP